MLTKRRTGRGAAACCSCCGAAGAADKSSSDHCCCCCCCCILARRCIAGGLRTGAAEESEERRKTRLSSTLTHTESCIVDGGVGKEGGGREEDREARFCLGAGAAVECEGGKMTCASRTVPEVARRDAASGHGRRKKIAFIESGLGAIPDPGKMHPDVKARKSQPG